MRSAAALGIGVWLLTSVAHAGPEEVRERPRLVAQAGHARAIEDVACSPDGRLVVTGGDSTARIWDAASGVELRRLVGRAGVVKAVAFSPDSRHVLTAETGALQLWDVATGAEVRRFEGDPEHALSDVAFRADGRQVVTAGPNRLVVLWDVATGTQIRSFEGHEGRVYAVAFSPNGRWIASAGRDRRAHLWDATTGREVRRYEGHTHLIRAIAFSPDGERLVTGSWDGSARVWHRASGAEELLLKGHEGWVSDVDFSPDGRCIVTASFDGTAGLWDARDGRLLRRLGGHKAAVNAACFSADGRHVLTGGEDLMGLLFDVETGKVVGGFAGRAERVRASCWSPDGRTVLTTGNAGQVREWDLQSGAPRRVLRRHEGTVRSVQFSTDGTRVLTAGEDRTARVCDASTGRELLQLRGHRYALWSAVYSRDGRRILTASSDKTARLWDAVSGEELTRFEGHEMLVAAGTLSPDGRIALTGSLDGTVRLWEAATGREIGRFFGHGQGFRLVSAVAFSPDAGRIATAGADRMIRIWDVESLAELLCLEGHTGGIRSICFSPDGARILSAGVDGSVRLWTASDGREVARLEGHSDEVFAASFSPDGRRILTSGDATARLWDAASGSEICRLVHFEFGSWAVVAPDGRFDTNWAEELRGLHWVMPDEPLRPLGVEVFARDYYEPRLLPRLLAGAAFPPVRPLQELNSVQPTVRITRIEPDPGRQDTASVTVEVRGDRRRYGGRERVSGAADLRLFRDGRLIRYTEGALRLDPETDRTLRVFSGVAVPRSGWVPFSAYAFNTDGVKSRTHRLGYERASPQRWQRRDRTAYVVAVGIDAFDDERWNLRFAVADARALRDQLSQRLARSDVYDTVVDVLLISAPGAAGGARREDLQTVCRLLAGAEVSPERRARIPGAERLRTARPEDLLVVTLSTHGATDAAGRFYLLPSDVAGGGQGEEWLRSCISADTLARWLRDVDAGEMVLIVDACHAAASVDSEGFKPGPMGSRGLGQLAYDKRMQVLAASQAADVALESARIRHGLLTYALVKDGLERGRADSDPPDGRISLTEWLRYGERRVPLLAAEILEGSVRAVDHRGPLRRQDRSARTRPVAQQPALFDFARREWTVILPR